MSSVARDASILIQSEKTTRLFDWVCDVKEAGGDKYYRFDESKCLVWLKRRVQKVETNLFELWKSKFPKDDEQGMKGYCHLEAIRLIGLFLSEDLLSSLSNSLSVPPNALEATHAEQRKWGIQFSEPEKEPTKKRGAKGSSKTESSAKRGIASFFKKKSRKTTNSL
ncbi:hypothetical protein WA538_005515 [Blastocystis sp. DL]